MSIREIRELYINGWLIGAVLLNEECWKCYFYLFKDNRFVFKITHGISNTLPLFNKGAKYPRDIGCDDRLFVIEGIQSIQHLQHIVQRTFPHALKIVWEN